MRLEPFASERDVDESLRLFTVSTLSAAMSGSLAGEFVCLGSYEYIYGIQHPVFCLLQ